MILVDTSIWADHVVRPVAELQDLLADQHVLVHPFVICELALGNLRNWQQTVAMLKALPGSKVASHEELLAFIPVANLCGSGVGFVDAHLLAACGLMRARLWTRDKRLASKADALGMNWTPASP
ncbi:MAG: PIN domain-containing protein [Allosphingosinicella sp.]